VIALVFNCRLYAGFEGSAPLWADFTAKSSAISGKGDNSATAVSAVGHDPDQRFDRSSSRLSAQKERPADGAFQVSF
jgi:hypothetical protein